MSLIFSLPEKCSILMVSPEALTSRRHGLQRMLWQEALRIIHPFNFSNFFNFFNFSNFFNFFNFFNFSNFFIFHKFTIFARDYETDS